MKITPLRTLPDRGVLHLQALVNRRNLQNQSRNLKKISQKLSKLPTSSLQVEAFISSPIHRYALIGHQVSSWISGYLWSQDLGLPFVADELSKNSSGLFSFPNKFFPNRKKIKTVYLPATTDERNPTSHLLLSGIIEYSKRRWPNKILRFRLSLDQARWDQTPASSVIRSSLLMGSHGFAFNKLEQSETKYIAIHVRRPAFTGDISPESQPNRWINLEWYSNVIADLKKVKELECLPIRLYALGDESEFESFCSNWGVELHINGDRDQDFIELAAAELLIAAPSSFSFTAGLASNGAVAARAPWWHNVPNKGRWIQISEEGSVSQSDVSRALAYSANLRKYEN